MKRNCDHCGNEYVATIAELKRGNGRFCSRSCARRHRPTQTQTPNATCAYCHMPFYCKPSRASKSGLLFCRREHKDLGQRLTSGLIAIHPPHYGSGAAIDYRALALQAYGGICHDCGWNDIPAILEVHHLDGNRQNNTVINLVVLCPRCHEARHYLARTGKWAKPTCSR